MVYGEKTIPEKPTKWVFTRVTLDSQAENEDSVGRIYEIGKKLKDSVFFRFDLI